MSLRLKGLGVFAAAAAGLLAAAAYAAAPPQTGSPEPVGREPVGADLDAGAASSTPANPWTTTGPDSGPINGRAAMALRADPDGKDNGIDNLSLIGAAPGGVPEPAAWALMIVGFGGVGGLLRRRRARRAFTSA
jgi:hypothetical protein